MSDTPYGPGERVCVSASLTCLIRPYMTRVNVFACRRYSVAWVLGAVVLISGRSRRSCPALPPDSVRSDRGRRSVPAGPPSRRAGQIGGGRAPVTSVWDWGVVLVSVVGRGRGRDRVEGGLGVDRQAGVPAFGHQHREPDACFGEVGEPGVAEVVQGPAAAGRGEYLGGSPVGQPGPAGGGVEVGQGWLAGAADGGGAGGGGPQDGPAVRTGGRWDLRPCVPRVRAEAD